MKNEHSSSLPVEEYKDDVTELLKNNPVIIVTAETGAGKSTRIPFWFFNSGKKVIVTEPRRIAARSLSHYVSGFSNTKWGEEVGYQTGFDRKKSSKTRLLYLTDGVQLVNEIKGNIFYDVLVIDEVHEWNLNQEVLVGMVKKRIRNRYYLKNDKRIIIMSATLRASQLSKFLEDAPVVKIPGRGFPVTIHNNSSYFMLSDTVGMVEEGNNTLVFLPGKKEISDFSDLLKEAMKEDNMKAKVLPLHSELNISEQSKIFEHFEVPKVVIATDIAQTSLTIDDIDAVIDSGIKKEIRTVNGIEGLYPVEISKTESLQRAGRAGRVKSGRYFLCSDFPSKEREQFPEPEIRRLNLESVILKLIKWGLDPLDFTFFHSPNRSLLKRGLETLKIFGAVDLKGNITGDGKLMAELPVSVRSARILLESMKGGRKTSDAALKIIAIMETRGINGQEYIGEKLHPYPYNSDLLNQFFLWGIAGKNKKLVNFKKFNQSKEIYKELKKRIAPANSTAAVSGKDEIDLLYRSVLSGFTDHFYKLVGDKYYRDDEERQPDRNSTLYSIRPEFVTGLPFDLSIESENRYTGEKERQVLRLLTFLSEINLKILRELNPFGYKRELNFEIVKNVLHIRETHKFGGYLITRVNVEPDYGDKDLKEKIFPVILAWWKKNEKKFPLFKMKEELLPHYKEIKKIVEKYPGDFQTLFENYLKKTVINEMNTKDMDIFFRFHSAFASVDLSDLLSSKMIETLKKKRWPSRHKIKDKKLKIEYFKNRPYLSFSNSDFMDINKQDVILPTGEIPGFIIDGRRFEDWTYAVYIINRELKVQLFKKKWKNMKKEADPDSLKDINFPVSFVGGKGMDGEKFTFYSVPEIEGKKVFLRHFFEKKPAEKYFFAIRDDWKKFLTDHKNQKLKNIFHSKGWKVK